MNKKTMAKHRRIISNLITNTFLTRSDHAEKIKCHIGLSKETITRQMLDYIDDDLKGVSDVERTDRAPYKYRFTHKHVNILKNKYSECFENKSVAASSFDELLFHTAWV